MLTSRDRAFIMSQAAMVCTVAADQFALRVIWALFFFYAMFRHLSMAEKRTPK